MLDRLSIAVINFSVNLVFVRLLTADDFGLLAMIAIFTAIAADISSCGLSDGLIHKAHPTEMDYSTVFVFNAGVGLLFGIAFFFGAPLVAAYFGHEQLTVVMRCLGVCFFFQTMGYVQETRLRKQLRMKAICMARVGATLTVSALGLAAAYLGYGYKALICTQILLAFFYFVYFAIASRWFPKIQFSRRSFKEFFGYGVHLMLAYFAMVIGRNINTSVLGRFYAASSMSGLYYQGSKLANTPFGVIEVSVNNTLFVVASNEEDADRQRAIFESMFSNMILIVSTVCLLMLVLGAPLIEFIYGDKWIGAIPVFRILAIAEALVVLRAFFAVVCKVHARTTFIRNMGFAEVALQLALLAIFYRNGILWIAWTQAAAVAATLMVYVVVTRGHFGLRLRTLLLRAASILWMPLLASATSAVALYTLADASAFWRCLIGFAIYAFTFIAAGEISQNPAYLRLRQKALRH